MKIVITDKDDPKKIVYETEAPTYQELYDKAVKDGFVNDFERVVGVPTKANSIKKESAMNSKMSEFQCPRCDSCGVGAHSHVGCGFELLKKCNTCSYSWEVSELYCEREAKFFEEAQVSIQIGDVFFVSQFNPVTYSHGENIMKVVYIYGNIDNIKTTIKNAFGNTFEMSIANLKNCTP